MPLDQDSQHQLEEFLSQVVARAKQQEAAWSEQIRGEIAAWVAYQIAHGQRFEVDHEGGPPWDSSGELRKLQGGFEPGDYETLGDFLQEPSGERHPTFERGCGWYFETRAKNLQEMVRDFVIRRLTELANDTARELSLTPMVWLRLLLDEEPEEHDASKPLEPFDLWELDRATPQEMLSEYGSCDLEMRWCEEAEAWPLQPLLEQGSLAARQRRLAEEIIAAEQRRVAAELAVRSRATFTLFLRDFEDHLGPFPERHTFTKKDPFWPELQRLLLDRWTAEERSLIAQHLSCSNSIREFLGRW